MVRKCQEIIQDCQKMFKKGQEMLRIGSRNCWKWSRNVRKLSGNVRKWSEIIRILSKIDKQTKKSGKIHLLYIQPERRRRQGWQQKKETTLNHPPHFYGSIFFLCSFLFFLFKSFHIGIGRQVVPYGSRFYTPIFDGLVKAGHVKRSLIQFRLNHTSFKESSDPINTGESLIFTSISFCTQTSKSRCNCTVIQTFWAIFPTPP